MTIDKESLASLSSFRTLSRLSSAKCQKLDVEYKSGAHYQGEVNGTQRSGRGVFTWTDGSQFDGEFINNKRHGKGVQTWPDGSRYDGGFEDDCKHGEGSHIWPSGETYIGSFFKDHRHGVGLYTWSNSNRYSGTFYMDKKEGYGKFTFANGNCFKGLYRNDEREGPGVMTYSDGRQDVGLWQRERLVKLCTNIDGINLDLSLHNFHIKPNEYQQYLPKITVVRQTLVRLGSANVLPPRAPQPLVYGYEPSPEMVSQSIVSDVLPASCLAADLQSFDEVFFAAVADLVCKQSSKSFSSHDGHSNGERDNENKTKTLIHKTQLDSCSLPSDKSNNGDDVIAWNSTPSCMSMQSHILRHSAAQKCAGFNVDAVLRGDRCEVTNDVCGPVEKSSERLIRAAAAGDISVIVKLIDEGEVNVDVADHVGLTALFAATMNCHLDVINYLLDNGADVNKMNDEGLSALAACFVTLYPPESLQENAAIGCYRQSVELDIDGDVQGKSHRYEKNSKKTKSQHPSKIDLKKISELRREYGSATSQRGGNLPEPVDASFVRLGIVHVQRVDRSTVDLDDDIDEAAPGNDVTSHMSEFDSSRPMNGIGVTVNIRQIEKCATMLSSNELIVGRERSATHNTWSEGTVRRLALEKSRWKLMQSTMHLLLRRGANPNTSSVPMPVLFFAVRNGDVDTVQRLLSKGANPNAKLSDSMGGLYPLHFACGLHGEEGIQITRMLLDSLADPDVRASNDESYLNRFLEEEWSKDVIDNESLRLLAGRTPLHIACCRENNHQNAHEVVKVLLQHHANPQVLCNGHSPLTLAITRGNDLAVDALLKAGADPNLVHTHGVASALCAAVCTDNEPRRDPDARIALIDRLIQDGANILAPVTIGTRRLVGTVVDYAHYVYNLLQDEQVTSTEVSVYQDPRVAHIPYHALTATERETSNARHRLLEHLGHKLRIRAVECEKERIQNDERVGRTSRNPSANFLYTGHGARLDSAVLIRKVSQSAASRATSAESDVRKPLFRYCYECGRTVNVRLTPCPRCKEVYYCSKPCLNKAWATVHKDECMRLPKDDRTKRSPSPGQKDKVPGEKSGIFADNRAGGLRGRGRPRDDSKNGFDLPKSTSDAVPSWRESLPPNCYVGNYSFV